MKTYIVYTATLIYRYGVTADRLTETLRECREETGEKPNFRLED